MRKGEAGQAVCRDHGRGREGRQMGIAVRRMVDEVGKAVTARSEVERKRAAGEFWRKVQQGEFTGLVEEPLRRVLAQAAEEERLALEIGALRVLLLRLLVEEPDLTKQALGASRVVQAIARAVRVQAGLVAAAPNDLEVALQQVLCDIDAGLLPLVDADDYIYDKDGNEIGMRWQLTGTGEGVASEVNEVAGDSGSFGIGDVGQIGRGLPSDN